jgi:hypothetical protein
MPCRCQQRRLEREDAQHMVDAAPDFLHPVGPPGPDRGADKCMSGCPARRSASRSRLKSGASTPMNTVRAARAAAARAIGCGCPQRCHGSAQHLHIAAHGQRSLPATRPRSPGLPSAAHRYRPPASRGQRACSAVEQQAGQQVAGGFAGHHGEARRGRDRRTAVMASADDAALRRDLAGSPASDATSGAPRGDWCAGWQCARPGLLQRQVVPVQRLVHRLDGGNALGEKPRRRRPSKFMERACQPAAPGLITKGGWSANSSEHMAVMPWAPMRTNW